MGPERVTVHALLCMVALLHFLLHSNNSAKI
jgi:hypothetical protein